MMASQMARAHTMTKDTYLFMIRFIVVRISVVHKLLAQLGPSQAFELIPRSCIKNLRLPFWRSGSAGRDLARHGRAGFKERTRVPFFLIFEVAPVAEKAKGDGCRFRLRRVCTSQYLCIARIRVLNAYIYLTKYSLFHLLWLHLLFCLFLLPWSLIRRTHLEWRPRLQCCNICTPDWFGLSRLLK